MKPRSKLCFYVNEKRMEIGEDQGFMTLSDFLRYERRLTGTKVVCAEGDCGACTVLSASVHEIEKGQLVFKSVNSCILPVFALDGCHIVTVEGLKTQQELHPVQSAMNEHFGSQCGFCTPGIVCAMASLVEDSKLEKKPITEKRAQNYLTGNLCRCTGYAPIVKAATAIDLKNVETLQKRFSSKLQIQDLQKQVQIPLEINSKNRKLFLPTTIAQALKIKAKYPQIRLVAGGTDVGVWVNKGRSQYEEVMSLQNIPELWEVKRLKNKLVIPARVTFARLQKYLGSDHEEFSGILNVFASLQIKNSGTLVGNVVNGSPIADSIPFLMVSDAEVEVQSLKGQKLIPMDEFFLGYKKLKLKPQEIVTAIHLPFHKGQQLSKLYKVSLRKDLDISAVTMAARFTLENKKIKEARIAFGGVGPVVLRLKQVEKNWLGQILDRSLLEDLSKSVGEWVTPLSDVRGSKEYRLLLCQNLLLKMADECL